MTTAQSVHIAYDDVGSGEPAIVFLHGLFEDRTYYRSQVEHLSPRHRVLSVDLRGHGESDAPAAPYSLDVLADDVIGVCEAAGVTQAVICSHSMALALRIATRRPDLAAGVVLLDGAVFFLPEAQGPMAGLLEALETDGWREALLGFFTSVAGPAAERVAADIKRAPRDYAAPMLRDIVAAARSEHAEELASLRCPLLYVHGAMPADLDRLRQAQPDVIIETVDGAGHYVMLAAPERLNAVLDRFLEVIR